MYQEYPKALYNGGAYVAVRSKIEESERREEGFLDWREDYDRLTAAQEDDDEDEYPSLVAGGVAAESAPRRRGRPPKLAASV